MELMDMARLSAAQLLQAAHILQESLPEGWPTLADAETEIAERLVPQNHLIAAVEQGQILGWGGVMPMFARVHELHPLVVQAAHRGQGLGAAILLALEEYARADGALTLVLGADDERPGGETSLANIDLYHDLPASLAAFAPGRHQSAFYLRQGYTVVGVIPDANGIGMPDIWLAKRLY